MGTNNSKKHIHSIPLSSATSNHRKRSSTNNKTMIHYGWQQIYQCSHNEWLHGISDMFGFVQHRFVCNSKLHNICAPGFCSESLLLDEVHRTCHSPLSSSKKHDLRSSITHQECYKYFAYKYIPATMTSSKHYYIHGIVNGCTSSNLHPIDVIILSMHSHICTLGDDYNGQIDTQKVYGTCSRDRTQAIIRIPLMNDVSVLDFYKIVKKEAKLYRRITPIDISAQFQFTPNYWTSRLLLYTNTQQTQITITNFNITSLTSTTSNTIQIQTIPLHQQPIGSHLSLVNIHSWSTYNTESIPVDDGFHLLSLLYTFDSVYIILVFSDSLCHCNQTFPLSYFDIYHANTFQRLHRINTQLMSHLCSWHMCQNMFTPIFSVSSSRMAYCTTKNNDGRELQISIVVLPNEMNLKSICRRLIVDYLHEVDGNVEDVASKLPYRLSQYIQHRPEYQ